MPKKRRKLNTVFVYPEITEDRKTTGAIVLDIRSGANAETQAFKAVISSSDGNRVIERIQKAQQNC